MATAFSAHLLDGLHAARPAATAVPEGTLYSCSDHALVYQSDGATWATWATLGASSAAGVPFTPAGTIAATNVQAAIEEVSAEGGGGDAWTEVVVTTDQTVTNSVTKVDHAPSAGPALSFSVTAGERYHCEFVIFYSGNDTAGDCRIAFAVPSLAKGFRITGWVSHPNNLVSAQGSTSDGATTQWPHADIGAYTDASHTIYAIHGAFVLNNETSGTVILQFANVTAGAGRESTIRADSLLRYRLLT